MGVETETAPWESPAPNETPPWQSVAASTSDAATPDTGPDLSSAPQTPVTNLKAKDYWHIFGAALKQGVIDVPVAIREMARTAGNLGELEAGVTPSKENLHPDVAAEDAAVKRAAGITGTENPHPEDYGARLAYSAVRPVPGALALGAGGIPARALQVVGASLGGTAQQATGEAGGGPGLQMLANLAGNVAPTTVQGVYNLPRSVAQGEAGSANMQAAIADSEKTGIPLSVGQAGGNKGLQKTEQVLGKVPIVGGPIQKLGENQAAATAENVGRMVTKLAHGATVSPTKAGEMLEEQLPGAIDNIKTSNMNVYNKAASFIPDKNAPIKVANARGAVDEVTTPITGAEKSSEALINPKFKKHADAFLEDTAGTPGIPAQPGQPIYGKTVDAQGNPVQVGTTPAKAAVPGKPGGTMPYSAVAALKTKVGSEIDWGPFPANPTENAQLIKFYTGLSKDQAAGIDALGGPQATAARQAADAEFQANMSKRELLNKAMSKVGQPEKLYTSLISGSKDGASMLKTVSDGLDQNGRELLAASFLKRAGAPNPGAANQDFSIENFATNFRRLSPEAREVLFKGLPGDYADNIDALLRNVDRIKAGRAAIPGQSPTFELGASAGGSAAFLESLLTGKFGRAAAILVGAGGGRLISKALTSPSIVKWLSKETAKVANNRALAPNTALSLTRAQEDNPEQENTSQ